MPDTADPFTTCATTVMAQHGAFRADDPLLDGPSAHGIGLGLLSVWIGGPADIAMLRALTQEDAGEILRSLVWVPLGAAQMPAGVDRALFAYALEAGVIQALADLQTLLGVPPSGLADAATLATARARAPEALASAIRAAHAAWRQRRSPPFAPAAARQRDQALPYPA